MAVASLLLFVSGSLAAAPQVTSPSEAPTSIPGYARLDPTLLVSARRCGECHEGPYRIWQGSAHAHPLATPEQKAKADRITGRMGFRFVRRDSLCLRCHYTAAYRGSQLRAASGVSCESCHGAAGDWIDTHSDYGEASTADHETEHHKRQRIARSRDAGMVRAGDLYRLFSNCYECHTIAHETLVERGGHSPGDDLELLISVERIRHNFLHSQLTGDGRHNEPFSDEHRRMIFVAGHALSLEHTFRALARSTHSGPYSRFMSRRLRWALDDLDALLSRCYLSEIAAILETGRSTGPSSDDPTALVAAADRIATLTRALLTNHDGSELGSLDPFLPPRGAIPDIGWRP